MKTNLLKIIFVFSLIIFLSGCSDTKINQYIGSDGTVVYEEDVNFEEYLKNYAESASSTEELAQAEEFKEAGQNGSFGDDICENFIDKVSHNAYADRYLQSGCIAEEYGAKKLAVLTPDKSGEVVGGVSSEGDYYIYSLENFFNLHEMPFENYVGYEDNEYDETPTAWRETYKLSVNLFFEDDVVYSDIGKIDGNKVSFSLEDIETISSSSAKLIIKAKKKLPAKKENKIYVNSQINIDGSGFSDRSNVDLPNFDEARKWWMSDKLLQDAFCDKTEDLPDNYTCGVVDGVIFSRYNAPLGKIKFIDNQSNYQLNIIDAIAAENLDEESRKKFISSNLLTDSVGVIITLPSEIIKSDSGVIDGKTLTINKDDFSKLKYNSVITFKKINNQANSPQKNSLNKSFLNNLKGKIVLKVEGRGEAYYINPLDQSVNYLGRPEDAFLVMRQQGLGISNKDLAKIPIAFGDLDGEDSDRDGLSNDFEIAIGSNPTEKDSDQDSYNDNVELAGGYNYLGAGSSPYNINFAKLQAGKILLQVEGKGQAWYVNPNNNKRYFLGRPGDAYQLMRKLGLGISNNDINKIIQN